jgi:twitching motility protein PilT
MDLMTLLKAMVEKKASDIHLTTGIPPQFRVDGNLLFAPEFNKILDPNLSKTLAYSILNPRQIEEFEKAKELDFSYGISGLGRFRVNLYQQRNCVALCARLIPYEIPQIEELGLPAQTIKDFAMRYSGLFLVTGAVGSGKSTTLAAMIDYVNTHKSNHIVTIEDPIEYLHKHKKSTIDQREVGTDTLSFAEALRHVFRQDPNIILVGEMRDLDTIHTALTLAETGHLILATLHTIDAIHTVSRIIDVFSPYQQQQIRVQLSMVLIGVLSQQLIPRKTGAGRVLAYEVMSVTPSIRSLIRENSLPQIYTTIQTGKKFGMVTMNQSLATLCQKGEIVYDEALRRATNADEFNTLLKGKESASTNK